MRPAIAPSALRLALVVAFARAHAFAGMLRLARVLGFARIVMLPHALAFARTFAASSTLARAGFMAGHRTTGGVGSRRCSNAACKQQCGSGGGECRTGCDRDFHCFLQRSFLVQLRALTAKLRAASRRVSSRRWNNEPSICQFAGEIAIVTRRIAPGFGCFNRRGWVRPFSERVTRPSLLRAVRAQSGISHPAPNSLGQLRLIWRVYCVTPRHWQAIVRLAKSRCAVNSGKLRNKPKGKTNVGTI